MEKILKSNTPRIVNVSSRAHRNPYPGVINFDDIKCEKTFSTWRSYGTSKAANILFTNEL